MIISKEIYHNEKKLSALKKVYDGNFCCVIQGLQADY